MLVHSWCFAVLVPSESCCDRSGVIVFSIERHVNLALLLCYCFWRSAIRRVRRMALSRTSYRMHLTKIGFMIQWIKGSAAYTPLQTRRRTVLLKSLAPHGETVFPLTPSPELPRRETLLKRRDSQQIRSTNPPTVW